MIIEQKLRDIQARAKEIENKMNSGDVSGDEIHYVIYVDAVILADVIVKIIYDGLDKLKKIKHIFFYEHARRSVSYTDLITQVFDVLVFDSFRQVKGPRALLVLIDDYTDIVGTVIQHCKSVCYVCCDNRTVEKRKCLVQRFVDFFCSVDCSVYALDL